MKKQTEDGRPKTEVSAVAAYRVPRTAYRFSMALVLSPPGNDPNL